MRYNVLFVILFITFTSWKIDKQGPWIITNGQRVTLYTRPLQYSKSPTPDSLIIQKIINEQENMIDYINNRLNTDFQSSVNIYLYNLDETKEKIGTIGGGQARSTGFRRNIYFTFRQNPTFNTITKEYVYLGAHEMVHIIADNQLGRRTTRFFGEGYACALSGNYGSKKQGDRMVFIRNDSTLAKIIALDQFLLPSALIDNDSLPAREYYPQIGCLVNWMLETYGAEKINRLYNSRRSNIKTKFQQVTGVSFEEMEKIYIEYCNTEVVSQTR
jgi:hypothetical protein